MPTTAESLVFDKGYYEEIVRRTWRPRNVGLKEEDFQTGTEDTHEEPQLMLKTDMCFWYDIDVSYPCCSRTNRWYGDTNRCDFEEVYSDNECTRHDDDSSRMEAVQSVVEFLGGGFPNENNEVRQAYSHSFTPALNTLPTRITNTHFLINHSHSTRLMHLHGTRPPQMDRTT